MNRTIYILATVFSWDLNHGLSSVLAAIHNAATSHSLSQIKAWSTTTTLPILPQWSDNDCVKKNPRRHGQKCQNNYVLCKKTLFEKVKCLSWNIWWYKKIFNKNKFKYLPTYICFTNTKNVQISPPNKKLCSNYEVAFIKCHPKDILLTIQIVKTCFIKYFQY